MDWPVAARALLVHFGSIYLGLEGLKFCDDQFGLNLDSDIVFGGTDGLVMQAVISLVGALPSLVAGIKKPDVC